MRLAFLVCGIPYLMPTPTRGKAARARHLQWQHNTVWTIFYYHWFQNHRDELNTCSDIRLPYSTWCNADTRQSRARIRHFKFLRNWQFLSSFFTNLRLYTDTNLVWIFGTQMQVSCEVPVTDDLQYQHCTPNTVICKCFPLMTFLMVFWSGKANMMEVLEARNSSANKTNLLVFRHIKKIP